MRATRPYGRQWRASRNLGADDQTRL